MNTELFTLLNTVKHLMLTIKYDLFYAYKFTAFDCCEWLLMT